MEHFKKLPFESNEMQLFFDMDFEKAERYGAIGYMRADFDRLSSEDFKNTFINDRYRPYSTFYKDRFKSVISYIRMGLQCPVYNDNRYSKTYYQQFGGQLLDDKNAGFKIQTQDITYYARCNYSYYGDYDVHIMAYDNRLLLRELAGQKKIPPLKNKRESERPDNGAR